MQQSESIADLATALSKAQGQIEGARKDSANPHFKNKYADLASVWEACRAALTANGLSVIQMPGAMEDGRVTMTTQLCHSSGQYVRETLSIPIGRTVDAQGYGSATTYARRYALAAAVGVAPEDDDGNAASRGGPAPANDSARVGDAQLKTLQDLASGVGADLQKFCKYFQVDSLLDIPASRYDDAVKALEAKRKVAA